MRAAQAAASSAVAIGFAGGAGFAAGAANFAGASGAFGTVVAGFAAGQTQAKANFRTDLARESKGSAFVDSDDLEKFSRPDARANP
jgi:hypothetical protein